MAKKKLCQPLSSAQDKLLILLTSHNDSSSQSFATLPANLNDYGYLLFVGLVEQDVLSGRVCQSVPHLSLLALSQSGGSLQERLPVQSHVKVPCHTSAV